LDLTEILKLWEVIKVWHRYAVYQKIALIIGLPVTLYFLYLVTIGRPSLVVHDLRLALLSDRVVRQLREGGEAFEIEFILRNSTSPPKEVHNMFANLWMDGQHFIQSIPAPLRGDGSARVQWDLNRPVFPKDSVIVDLPKISVRMPTPGDEVIVGAQIVADEIEKKEYLWKFVNENGSPKIVFVRNPDGLR
jgi:hypothetical protein